MLPAREAMARHAILRLFDRKGIALTIPAYERVCTEIAARTDGPMAVGYGGRVFYRVRVGKADVLACWDPEHRAVVTFVPQLPSTARPTTEAAA